MRKKHLRKGKQVEAWIKKTDSGRKIALTIKHSMRERERGRE